AGSLYRARGDEVLGVVRIRQQRYPEAIKLLHQAIATYDVQFKDQRATSWFRLGEAHEGMGDDKNAVQAYEASLDLFEQGRMELYEASRMGFVGNSTEVYERLITLYADSHGGAYDPKQALYWLEKSKSRTLAETLGLAQISLQNPPASIQDDLQEERFLLERVNTLRAQLFLSSPEAPETASRLQLQQELFQHLEKLKALWNRIANVVPEYVNLRQGLVVQWDELQVLFEPA
ncbi:MAG: tetratricopeptide repeat protein, partial [Ktedonobacteraceae bacterium]